MDRHPDAHTLLAFREHRLAGSAVAEVGVHVGRCAQCAKVEPSVGRVAFAALVAEEHLSDAELDLLIDRREDNPAYPLVARHTAACAMCRSEVEDLRRLDAERTSSSRIWLIAASVAFALLALSAIVVLVRRAADAPVTASNPPVAPVTATPPPAPKVVASLADGDSRIELLENGTITGVEPSLRDAEDVRKVLSGRAIAIPAFIAAMPGAVRGGDGGVHPLRAIAPFRTAVRETRPRFSWSPVNDAKTYTVAVFDANYDEVTRSEALNGTSWTPSQPLPAGVDLSWHVVAETEAGEISSAGSDRAEAVFRVLTPKEAAEVAAGESQYRESHLLRGLVHSRYGLLREAEQDFRQLAQQNPDSPVVRDLVRSVSR